MRKVILISAIAGAVVVASPIAVATSAPATNPKTLVLQKTDLPAGAVKQADFVPPVTPSTAHYEVVAYRIGNDGREVTSAAYVFATTSAAKRAFGPLTAAFTGGPKLATPRLGDHQFVGGLKTPFTVIVHVYVRSGNVVWGVAETRISRSATLTQVARSALELARKQHTRVAAS